MGVFVLRSTTVRCGAECGVDLGRGVDSGSGAEGREGRALRPAGLEGVLTLKNVLGFFLIVGCSAPAPTEPPRPAHPSPPDTRVEELLDRLGADDLNRREEAERDLLAMGDSIAPRLRDFIAHADGERKARAQSILDRLTGSAPLPAAHRDALDKTLRTSHAFWKKEGCLGRVDDAMAAAPKATIQFLLDRLEDVTPVHGHPEESSIYTICGGAISLLEEIADVTFDDAKYGHDHRSWQPEPKVVAAWREWWAKHRDAPIESIWCGLDFETRRRVKSSLREPKGNLKDAVAMGKRIVPYLIQLIDCDAWARGDGHVVVRVCDEANRLLRLITGQAFGEIARYDALEYDPKDPMRQAAHGLTMESIAQMKSKWVAWWESNK